MGTAPPEPSLATIVTGAFLVSLATVAIPGPITLVASRLAMRRLAPAVWFLLGVTALDVALFAALVAGAGPAVRAIGEIPMFEVLGGFVLLWAGIAALRRPRPTAPPTDREGPERRRDAAYFLLGVAVAGGNPQYWFWWLSAGVAFIQASRAYGPAGMAWLLAALIGGVGVWYAPLLAAIQRGKTLLSPRIEVMVRKGLAVIMAALGLALVVVGVDRL